MESSYGTTTTGVAGFDILKYVTPGSPKDFVSIAECPSGCMRRP